MIAGAAAVKEAGTAVTGVGRGRSGDAVVAGSNVIAEAVEKAGAAVTGVGRSSGGDTIIAGSSAIAGAAAALKRQLPLLQVLEVVVVVVVMAVLFEVRLLLQGLLQDLLV